MQDKSEEVKKLKKEENGEEDLDEEDEPEGEEDEEEEFAEGEDDLDDTVGTCRKLLFAQSIKIFIVKYIFFFYRLFR